MKHRFPVASPVFLGNEKEYVLDCLDSTWISSKGKYIEKFEREFADYLRVDHAVACANGTAALHLALKAVGIGPGDEVIVPTMTFVASANAVTYCGARPVFVDSDRNTWNIDVASIEEKVTNRTKAIMVVHLYGFPVQMDKVLSLARKRDLLVVEDAAEAHGAEFKGKKVGGFGHVSAFSFYGNKIITTGEGGMVVTSDPEIAKNARLLRGQGQDLDKRYWFPQVGYNYRMTNIEAALGLAQLEQIDEHLRRRRQVAAWYEDEFQLIGAIEFSPKAPWAKNVYWMSSVVLRDGTVERDVVRRRLSDQGIETRPFFIPMHLLPAYKGQEGVFPVAEELARTGINLPSSANLREADVRWIARQLVQSLDYEHGLD